MNNSRSTVLLFAAAMLCCVLGTANADCDLPMSVDFDGDCVPDAVEDALLSALAPVVIAGGDDGTGGPPWPPLPVWWYVEHCRLMWYAPGGGIVGSTGDAPTSISTILNTIASHHAAGESYLYSLQFRNGAHRHGLDAANPMSWEIAQSQGMGIYGRVTPIAPTGTYRVQYFMLFGFNDTDSPDDYGCDFGNHEGDWICVEYVVTAPNPSSPTIERAIYHNHGRQIFVAASSIEFAGSHPKVYLERGSNEPWPYAGEFGFVPGQVPRCISTNEVFADNCGCEILPPFNNCCGGESSGWSAVREHVGDGPQYLVSTVVNLGEGAAKPGPSLEAQFVQRFAGAYGSYADDQCGLCIPCGVEWCCEEILGVEVCVPCGIAYCCVDLINEEVSSPPGPPYQDKMWLGEYSSALVWPTSSVVYVDFGYTGVELGSAAAPYDTLAEALAEVVPGGEIRIAQGASSETLTLECPNGISIIATNGTVTIGQ